MNTLTPLLMALILVLPAGLASAAPDDWTGLDQQATAQYRGGDYAAARVAAQQALELAERGAAKPSATLADKARVATSLNLLAMVEQAQGQLDIAVATLERASTTAEAVLPPGHANLTALRGNLEAARESLRREQADRQALGLQALNEQAIQHHQSGEYEQAAALYARALPAVEQHFGSGSPEAARVLAGLADTQFMRKQYAESEASYQRAITILEAHKEEATALSAALNALAGVHYAQRQYGKAEALFLRALQTLEARPGHDPAELLTVLDNLDALYRSTGRPSRAEEFRQRAKAIRRAQPSAG